LKGRYFLKSSLFNNRQKSTPQEIRKRFDAAVCHHLRSDHEWESVFCKCVAALKPGGCFWISDLIEHADPDIQDIMIKRYADYLEQLRGADFPAIVFDCIELEDTPRPLLYQVHLLHKAGIKNVEILHKNGCFAAFGGVRKLYGRNSGNVQYGEIRETRQSYEG